MVKLTFSQSTRNQGWAAIALLFPITLALSVVGCKTVNSMGKVSSVLAQQYGLQLEEVGVGFWEEAGTKDSLEIIIPSKRFPGLTEAQMQAKAKEMAQMAYQHYDDHDHLKAIAVKFEAPAKVYAFQVNELSI